MKKPVVEVANKEATVISDNQAVETKSAMGDGGACVIANRHIIKSQKSMK